MVRVKHCVKSVRIRSFFGPYFPAFGVNMKRYFISLRIQSEYGKIRTSKIPNTDTFYAEKSCSSSVNIMKVALNAYSEPCQMSKLELFPENS